MKKIFLILTLIFSIFSQNIFCQSSEEPVPYGDKEIPSWLKHVRRTEIITLGSMPFVTIGVTLGYSFYNLATHNFDGSYFVNPFTKEGSYSKDEQIGIIVTASMISLGIGVTNLAINLIRDGINKNKKTENLQSNIKITTINNEINIYPIPQKYKREKEYLFGNIESAVF
ncbi:MAG: hypothetical protein KBT21_08775 [Treponema sp.]|nr:hypothetical protein [Candidatus Treponema merdequi]